MPIRKIYYKYENARIYGYDTCFLCKHELYGKALGNIVLYKLVKGPKIYDVEKNKSKIINVDGIEHEEVNASYIDIDEVSRDCPLTPWSSRPECCPLRFLCAWPPL